MTFIRRKTLCLAAAIASILAVPGIGAAQTASTEPALSVSKGSGQAYPNRPVRFIVSFPPGSVSDIVLPAYSVTSLRSSLDSR